MRAKSSAMHDFLRFIKHEKFSDFCHLQKNAGSARGLEQG